MGYQACVFDLFGTLVPIYSRPRYYNALSQMASSVSISFDDFNNLWSGETLQMRDIGLFSSMDENIEYICKKLGKVVDQDAVRRAVSIRTDYLQQSLLPRKNVIETLKKIKNMGCKVGLISDCAPDVPLLWPNTLLSKVIESPIFSCQVKIKKPNPEIYILMSKRLGVNLSACLYIGDGGSNELEGAAKVGMRPVLFRNANESSYDLHREGIVNWTGLVISEITQLIELLSSEQ